MDIRILSLVFLSTWLLGGSGFIYLKKGKKSLSVSILSFFLLSLGLIFSETLAINYFGHDNTHPLIILGSYMRQVLCLILPPTFYLYIISLLEDKDTFLNKNRLQLYYAPAILLFIINSFSFVALYNIEVDSRNYILLETVLTYCNFISLFFIFLIQNIYYIFSATMKYFEYKKINTLTEESNAVLKWIKLFIGLYTLLILLLYLFQLRPLFPGKIVFRGFTIIYAIIMIYYGVKDYHFKIMTPPPAPKESVLERNKILELKGPLLEMMENEKPFLNLDITLNVLAGQLGTNSKYLSFLINNEFDCNFSSFVNSYRIKHAKMLLENPENKIYTIQSIAEMTGFKSKSAFNHAFKKETQMTPSKYKQMVLGD